MQREPRLFFCVGAMRSGKSTLARRWLRREIDLGGFLDDGYPRFMWDTDALRLEVHGERYNRRAESFVYSIKRYAIGTALRLGHDVIVAGTHSTKASVRRLLEIRRDAIPVVIDTPLDVCLERARETDQLDLLDVIPRVHERVTAIKEMGVENFIQEVLDDIDSKVPY